MATVATREGEFGLQIAPMLDVLFVLLLFFMVAAGAIKHETAITTRLPGYGSPKIPVQVLIDAAGSVDLNGASYDAVGQNELPATVTHLKLMLASDPNLSVLIPPQPATRQQRVVDVLNACTAAGVKNLAFGASGG